MEFLPHLRVLIDNVNCEALNGLDHFTTGTDTSNGIDPAFYEDARCTASANVELGHLLPLVSCEIIPEASLLVVAISESADQEDMDGSLLIALSRPLDRHLSTNERFTVILTKTKGRIASSKARITGKGFREELALIKLRQFDAHFIFSLHQHHRIFSELT